VSDSRPFGVVVNGMIDIPRMLMIGYDGRNSGQTELACSLIDKFRTSHIIVGIKVTTDDIDAGTDTNTHYLINQETDRSRDMDTGPMLAAGAHKVYRLRTQPKHLHEGVMALLKEIGKDSFIICESNSLRSVVNPGLFFICRHQGEDSFIDSAEVLQSHMDSLITYTDGRFDLDLNDVNILPGGWALRADATAIILAGGMSQRMQRDKSLLPVAGTPMIERIHDQLHPHFKQMLVSANDVDKYAFLHVKIVPDSIIGQGPLMGITSALEASTHDLNFITACDMPNVNMVLVRRMLREAEGFEAVVPIADGLMEPLFAVYRKSVLGAFRDALAQGKRRIRAAFGACKINYLDITEFKSLTNLNTREDYDGFISLLAEDRSD